MLLQPCVKRFNNFLSSKTNSQRLEIIKRDFYLFAGRWANYLTSHIVTYRAKIIQNIFRYLIFVVKIQCLFNLTQNHVVVPLYKRDNEILRYVFIAAISTHAMLEVFRNVTHIDRSE